MADRVRVLALDHFSAQDRNALVAAGGDKFAWRTIPYWHFRNRANAVFPLDVLEGLAAWARPELETERRAYADWCRRELGRLYVEWPYDIVVLPSDAFYYVRAFPEICHELGVPVLVAQKETTITDYFMREHAPDVREHAPFVSDRMTVCSERHKRFWVEAGADPALIEVTGQPRFDVYARAAERRGIGERAVLYLSYEPDAYLLDPADREQGWLDLRDETERVLVEAAGEGWNVLVKLHPLQDRAAEEAALDAKTQGAANVRLAPADADTRELIVEADAIVGFQTTALYEALAADKPVAYTAWGALYDRFRTDLIPFDERPDLLHVARSGDELAAWLRDPQAPDGALRAARLAFVEEMLGPIDGLSSERTLAAIRAEVESWSGRARASERRRALDRLRRLTRPVLLAVAGAQAGTLRGVSRVPGRIGASAAHRLPRHAERFSAVRRSR